MDDMKDKYLDEAEQLADQVNRKIDARFKSTESWLSSVEAKVDHARTHETGGRASANALPEQYRHSCEIAERMGHKDPVGKAMFGAWWDLHIKLASQAMRPTPGGAGAIERDLEMLGRGWGLQSGAVHKSLSEGTSGSGGYTVATPVEAELYRLIRDNTVVRPNATKIVMMGPTVQLPSENLNITASIVSEMLSITESAATASQFTQIALVARKFAGWATVSNELLQDNVISLQEYLFSAIAESIGILEDQAALDGSTGVFTGLDNSSGVNSFTTSGVTSGGDLPSFAELINAVYGAKQRGSRVTGRFWMHPTAFKSVAGMVDTTGQPIFSFSNVPNAIPQFIGGYPVDLVSSLSLTKTIKSSSTNIYFGPANKIIFGDIAGMQFDIDPFSLFQRVMTNIRVIKRTGIAIPVPSAFTIVHGVKNS
jgi:HK97 family phage major capsid protein